MKNIAIALLIGLVCPKESSRRGEHYEYTVTDKQAAMFPGKEASAWARRESICDPSWILA